ncbi:MAG: BON domain-containing protein [Planctomycetales bacterium]|nr:BON domain-containing protein [Planctomycetales bacterium]
MRIVSLFSVVLIIALGQSQAFGQTFGARTTGGTISAGNRTAFGGGGNGVGGVTGSGQAFQQLESLGSVEGGERYIRDNRQATQFVGNDSLEQVGFVGVVGRGLQNVNANGGSSFVGGLSGGGLGGMTGGLGGGLNSGLGGLGGRNTMGGGLTGGLGGMTGGLGMGAGGLGGIGGTSRLGGGGLGTGGLTGGLTGAGVGSNGMGIASMNAGGMGAGGFGGQTGFGAAGNANRSINFQTQMKVRFRHPERSTTISSSDLQQRLNHSSRIPASSNVQVQSQGQTVTLTGYVPNDEARVLAVQLALLEPGVTDVVDQMTVGSEDPYTDSDSNLDLNPAPTPGSLVVPDVPNPSDR